MKLIACVNNDWAIGKDNHLLYHIREDMKFFKNMTMNNIVIMGRKTLESLPHPEKGLPNRTNIIISKNLNLDVNPNFITVHDLDSLLTTIETMESDKIFVIGGTSIYNLLLQFCDTAYITKVNDNIPDADAIILNLDYHPDWYLTESSDIKTTETGLQYQFLTYKKKGFINNYENKNTCKYSK